MSSQIFEFTLPDLRLHAGDVFSITVWSHFSDPSSLDPGPGPDAHGVELVLHPFVPWEYKPLLPNQLLLIGSTGH